LIDGRGLDGDDLLTKTEGLVLSEDGTVCTTEIAGGGGFGEPRERPIERVIEDVQNQLVSLERAALDYGVVLDANLTVDAIATRELRG
jgi:N-methylhydantoinase B